MYVAEGPKDSTTIESNHYYWPGNTSKVYWGSINLDADSATIGSNNCDANPFFKDAANNNYRLGGSSPCKDTGVNVSSDYAYGLSPEHTSWDDIPPKVKSERRREFGYWEKGAYVISDMGSLGSPVLRIKN